MFTLLFCITATMLQQIKIKEVLLKIFALRTALAK